MASSISREDRGAPAPSGRQDPREGRDPPRKFKSRAKPAAAVLLGAAAALVLGELLVRATGRAPEVAAVRRGRFQLSANPRLLYEPVPGLAYDAAGPTRFFEWRGRSNRLGFRDRERSPSKPPGTYRVLVLGDSIAAGYRVERGEEVFPAVLERRLAGGPPDSPAVEVLNFAVTGYNTAQEVELLRTRALPFSPDLVLLAWCHNDLRPPDRRILAALREAHGGRRVLAPAAADRALTWSALYRLARWGLGQGLPEETEEAARASGSWDGVEGALAELAALARRHDFEVLLAVFPYLPKPYDREHAAAHARLAALARGHGFHHLDLRDAFRSCREAAGAPRRRTRLDFDRYHPTPAGHACAAAALAPAVDRLARSRSRTTPGA